LGKKVSEGSGEGYWHTAGQWLSYIWSSLGEKTPSNYNIITMINEIKGKLFDKVDTRSSIRMSVGSGNYEDIGVNVAKYIDFTIAAQYLNGIMYCNAGTQNTYEILLISPTVLFNLLDSENGFQYNSINGQFTYLGTNVINKNTIINGRKPYYLGYRLPINSSVMLPFAFGNAILVSTSDTTVTVTSAENIVHPLTMIS